MYKCQHFDIKELVSKEVYESAPEWKLWLAFDQRILEVADVLREEINEPITINNWSWTKHSPGHPQYYSESGLRVPGMKYYSPWSQHSYGRALDMKFKYTSAHEVRKKIKILMDNGEFDSITQTITCEEGPAITWVHADVRSSKHGYNEFLVK